jgi:hypothetical protein
VGTRLVADERAYRRKAAVERSVELADRLDGYPAWRRNEWLREMAAAHLDPRTRPPMRHDLFARHLAPFVLAAYRDQEPGAARWLLALHRRISSSGQTRALLRPEEEDLHPIRQRALDDAPEDVDFRLKLMRTLMNEVDHWGRILADGRADQSLLAMSRGRAGMLRHAEQFAELAARVARDLEAHGVDELWLGDTPEAARVRAEATLAMVGVTRERYAHEEALGQMISRKS